MRVTYALLVAALGMAMAGRTATADDLGTPIDLSNFSEITQDASSVQSDVPLEEVARQFGTAPRRFYLSGMIGPSFANVSSPSDSTFASSDTLFNAGGALGVAFEREHGRLRLEVEGMGRSTYDAPFASSLRPDANTVLTNNWSVMQNFWRDLMLTDRFGVYGGGGIGAGGYVLGETFAGTTDYTSPAANFAWQAGGGLLWQLSDRLTFDVGYRYFQINTIQQADYVVPNQFAASELMFSLRLYEPFRNWRR
jgi:opacity protein-like surface antigen